MVDVEMANQRLLLLHWRNAVDPPGLKFGTDYVDLRFAASGVPARKLRFLIVRFEQHESD
tara:strand:+ start:351 stop:530 length:180 start_codon:yes stop_codon:yes gene_type:complete